jgi:hypothetical protein
VESFSFEDQNMQEFDEKTEEAVSVFLVYNDAYEKLKSYLNSEGGAVFKFTKYDFSHIREDTERFFNKVKRFFYINFEKIFFLRHDTYMKFLENQISLIKYLGRGPE